ncbi:MULTISPECIES: PilZ domain-containing protein [Rhodobacterales]|uniref:PilZ domain-containing protein n=1 Tax=Rhodobacterales TaxID=204455 RepID=UPI0032968B3A
MQLWRKNRAPTRYSANLLVGGGSHRVTIMNVHDEGVGLEGAPQIAVGATVTLQVIHHRLPAKVVWRKGTASGVVFQTRLGPQILTILRRLVGQPIR